MRQIKVGFCKYCGHAIKLMTEKGKVQADWDEMATKKCQCPNRPRRKRKAKQVDGISEE